MRKRELLLLAFVVGAAVAACNAAKEARTPQAPQTPQAPAGTGSGTETTQDIETLEASMRADEDRLEEALGRGGKDSSPVSGAAPTELMDDRGAACANACRALESMRRAAEGICRMAGEGDERCDRARDRVRAAEDVVRDSGCTC